MYLPKNAFIPLNKLLSKYSIIILYIRAWLLGGHAPLWLLGGPVPSFPPGSYSTDISICGFSDTGTLMHACTIASFPWLYYAYEACLQYFFICEAASPILHTLQSHDQLYTVLTSSILILNVYRLAKIAVLALTPAVSATFWLESLPSLEDPTRRYVWAGRVALFPGSLPCELIAEWWWRGSRLVWSQSYFSATQY